MATFSLKFITKKTAIGPHYECTPTLCDLCAIRSVTPTLDLPIRSRNPSDKYTDSTQPHRSTAQPPPIEHCIQPHIKTHGYPPASPPWRTCRMSSGNAPVSNVRFASNVPQQPATPLRQNILANSHAHTKPNPLNPTSSSFSPSRSGVQKFRPKPQARSSKSGVQKTMASIWSLKSKQSNVQPFTVNPPEVVQTSLRRRMCKMTR